MVPGAAPGGSRSDSLLMSVSAVPCQPNTIPSRTKSLSIAIHGGRCGTRLMGVVPSKGISLPAESPGFGSYFDGAFSLGLSAPGVRCC